MHRLVSLQGSPCRFKREEAQSWFDQPFDEAMILFDEVVEIFDLPQFHALRQDPTRFEVGNGFGIGGILRTPAEITGPLIAVEWYSSSRREKDCR